MICNKCGQNHAEIYYKQTINGNTVEYALCSKCAEELKMNGKLNIKMPLDDFPFGIYGDELMGLKELFGLPHDNRQRAVAEKKKCTLCSSTFDDLVKTGRIGCAECYKVFADELKANIERIHGKNEYMGKGNVQPMEEQPKPNEIVELKKQLEQAINEQEFEKAAVLRDKIREKEQPKDNA